MPAFYWTAKRDPRDLLPDNLALAIYAWQHGGEGDLDIQPRDECQHDNATGQRCLAV